MRTGNDTIIEASRPGRPRGFLAAALAFGMALAAGGCRKDMYDQPKYKAYDPSTIFPDGTSSRPQIEGTVARGDLRDDTQYYQGKVDGKDAETFPYAVDREMIELGRQRYQIYCTPCHGRLGNGQGMVVRRGFSAPPTFHSEYFRKKEVGHFFQVITNGHGAMYSYAARIPVDQRWAIVAYIRTLQYSWDANPEDLSPDDKKTLAGLATPGKPTTDERKSLAEVSK